MENTYVTEQMIKILCKGFQSVWLIKLADLSMEIFVSDDKKAIPHSIDAAKIMNNYDNARIWYSHNFIVEHSQERVIQQTAVDYVLNELKNGNSFYVEYSRVSGGEINFNQLCYDKINNAETGEPEYLVLGFRNIDFAKKAEIDDLTGLYNRPIFFRKAEEMLHNHPEKQYDVVLTDIVDFKKVNETYGANVADEIIKWEGKYFSKYIAEDMLIGRFGGDQMVAFGSHDKILSFISPGSRKEFATAEAENNLPGINIKMGVYVNVRHDRSIVSTCDKAHIALNSIKHQYNKDVAFYNDEIKDHMEKQRKIESTMHESLKNGDFKVYFQPKHDAKTGKLVGAEALVRWIHPEYGFMSPADFIPLFEQNGFIVENDYFVLTEACKNLRKWQDMGFGAIPISINSSKLTMINFDFIRILKKTINEYQIDPSLLHIEITETLMDSVSPRVMARLEEIRDLGIKIELDDFGSGYSSLNVLSELPIDIVKLDMSFLQQFGDKKRTTVLESCINLAKKLGFETVSEGVELKEQQELLGELGVDLIQGYYFSKPLSKNEFEIYMIEHLS